MPKAKPAVVLHPAPVTIPVPKGTEPAPSGDAFFRSLIPPKRVKEEPKATFAQAAE